MLNFNSLVPSIVVAFIFAMALPMLIRAAER